MHLAQEIRALRFQGSSTVNRTRKYSKADLIPELFSLYFELEEIRFYFVPGLHSSALRYTNTDLVISMIKWRQMPDIKFDHPAGTSCIHSTVYWVLEMWTSYPQIPTVLISLLSSFSEIVLLIWWYPVPGWLYINSPKGSESSEEMGAKVWYAPCFFLRKHSASLLVGSCDIVHYWWGLRRGIGGCITNIDVSGKQHKLKIQLDIYLANSNFRLFVRMLFDENQPLANDILCGLFGFGNSTKLSMPTLGTASLFPWVFLCASWAYCIWLWKAW